MHLLSSLAQPVGGSRPGAAVPPRGVWVAGGQVVLPALLVGPSKPGGGGRQGPAEELSLPQSPPGTCGCPLCCARLAQALPSALCPPREPRSGRGPGSPCLRGEQRGGGLPEAPTCRILGRTCSVTGLLSVPLLPPPNNNLRGSSFLEWGLGSPSPLLASPQSLFGAKDKVLGGGLLCPPAGIAAGSEWPQPQLHPGLWGRSCFVLRDPNEFGTACGAAGLPGRKCGGRRPLGCPFPSKCGEVGLPCDQLQ